MKKNMRQTSPALSPKKLERLLRAAERAHAVYEEKLGKRDENWPRWYATYLAERLGTIS